MKDILTKEQNKNKDLSVKVSHLRSLNLLHSLENSSGNFSQYEIKCKPYLALTLL